MSIDLTQLAPTMRRKALECQDRFPFVSFLSGRRDTAKQARAMAIKIVNHIQTTGRRDWVRTTYRRAARLQTLIDLHPDWKTVQDFEDGLLIEMDRMPDEERNQISRHFTGEAVDLTPLEAYHADAATDDKWLPTEQGWLVINWIRAQPETSDFRTRESGRRSWHWACAEPVTKEV